MLAQFLLNINSLIDPICIGKESFLEGADVESKAVYENWMSIPKSLNKDTKYLPHLSYKGLPVVAKRISAATKHRREAAMKEAFLLNKLKDLPGMVRLELCVISGSSLTLIMEELHGDLGTRKNVFLSKSWATRLNLLTTPTETFIEFHDKGLIHSDIKPENLMFDEAMKLIKVIDLGLMVDKGTRIVGFTSFYASPELITENYQHLASEKDDVWSWALTIVFVLFPSIYFDVIKSIKLTTYTAFDVKLLPNILEQIKKESETTGIPFDIFIKSWLQEKAENRPTMKAMLEDLKFMVKSAKSISKNKEKKAGQPLKRVQKLNQPETNV